MTCLKGTRAKYLLMTFTNLIIMLIYSDSQLGGTPLDCNQAQTAMHSLCICALQCGPGSTSSRGDAGGIFVIRDWL